MPLPLPRRSKYDRITHEKIAKSIEDDQRDYSDLNEFEKQFFRSHGDQCKWRKNAKSPIDQTPRGLYQNHERAWPTLPEKNW